MTLEKTKANILDSCDSILSRIKEWDNELESGIELIEKNEIDIKKIQDYYKESPNEAEQLQLQEEYQQKIKALVAEMGKFIIKIEEKKQALVDERKQYPNSEAIIENYISADLKSVFIDKDF